MNSERKKEILFLYIGYFVTLAASLIPSLSWYAVGALALQLLYAVIRYVSMGNDEYIFRSHAFNYILAIGVSFALVFVIIVQAQTNGLELTRPLTSFISGFGSNINSANSLGYVLFIILLEAIVAIFWPMVLISRGLYLINTGRPIFGILRPPSTVTPLNGTRKAPNGRWLASAVMSDGRVVQFEISSQTPMRVIGRDSEQGADIILDDATVSGRHARVELKNGSIWISDLGSTNKTKIGGETIGFNARQLRPSDSVQLGHVTLTFSIA